MGHSTLIGVVISLVANVCVNCGLNIQKWAHMKTAIQSEIQPIEKRPVGAISARVDVAKPNVFKSCTWALGLAVQLSGEAGNMVAYSFAATSIIAPLGAVGLLTNLLIATVFLGEPFRSRDAVGALGCGAGAAVIAIFAPATDLAITHQRLVDGVLLRPAAMVFFAVAVAAGVTMFWMFKTGKVYKVWAPLLVSAAFAVFTLFAVKSISLLIQQSALDKSGDQLSSPIFIAMVPVLAVSGPGQVYWLNQALGNFEASSVVPSYYVFFSITAIAVGGVVFHDFQNMPYNNIGFFACGVALCIAGVLVINSGRDAPSLPLGGPGDPAADGADSEGDGQTVAVSAEGGASEATKLLSGGSRGSSSEEAGHRARRNSSYFPGNIQVFRNMTDDDLERAPGVLSGQARVRIRRSSSSFSSFPTSL